MKKIELVVVGKGEVPAQIGLHRNVCVRLCYVKRGKESRRREKASERSLIVETEMGSNHVIVESGQVDNKTWRMVVGARNREKMRQKAWLMRDWSNHTLCDPIENGGPNMRLPLGGIGKTQSRRF